MPCSLIILKAIIITRMEGVTLFKVSVFKKVATKSKEEHEI